MKDLRADAVPVSIDGARGTRPFDLSTRGTHFADYVALTKPRLNFLVVATSAAGYYLGASGTIDATAMTQAVGGTALVAGGAAVLNQLYERDTDALMRRTRLRPLAASARAGPDGGTTRRPPSRRYRA